MRACFETSSRQAKSCLKWIPCAFSADQGKCARHLVQAISRKFIKQIHSVEFKFKQISQIATELAHPSVDYVTMTLTILAMFATRRQKLYNSSKYDVSWMYLLPISDRLQTLIPVMGVVCLLSSSVCKHVCACLLAAQLASGKV